MLDDLLNAQGQKIPLGWGRSPVISKGLSLLPLKPTPEHSQH